ncbi:N4-gp56 family major capsid protein [Maridesulfovibrio bastinii]|uniref:N4-gp56 family major capsid protein n=1 Tax=Maridesulfovibrio bastinii TaxID=47157 RepID=UPI000425C9C5|nr:N4-gp56 family major capsid protein [Maridesulfovibrio bastinii]
MADTEFGLNDPLAVQRWSNSLAVEAAKKQYFNKFMGEGDDSLIKVKKELEKGKGDKITVGLRMKLSGDGVEGDNTIEGTAAEEALTFFNDKLTIDQRRKGTRVAGKMTEQRVPYNLRKESRDALSIWFAEDSDEQIMMYLAGARGINADFHVPTSFTGRADNALQVPDAGHIIYGGDATGKANIDAADLMALGLVEKLVAKAETSNPMMLPFLVDGEKKFVLLMHTYQAYALRTSTSENDWLEIQKAVGLRGPKNNIYKNALGEYSDVIMHKHRNVIRFSDYGAGGDVSAARALFLGAQAGMIAFGGSTKKNRYSWNEETDDRGNKLAVTAGCIYGVKKSRYNSKDFGVIAVDTACSDPNA